jgi:phosphoglycolate phosphatase
MKTLIFDFDGTLADSFELAVEIAKEIGVVGEVSKAEINNLRGLPPAKIIRELGIPLTRLPRLVVKGRQLMHGRIGEVHPFKDIPYVVEKLHAAGYQLLVISSNSEQNVRTFLRANGIEPYFDSVQGVGLFNKAASLRRVLRRLDIQAADCFYIGDEVRDVLAATKARIEPVAVTWGYQAAAALEKYHPFALARKPQDLLAIFGTGKV